MTAETGELLTDLARGKMIVLMDDEDRENEGDLLVAAQFADAKAINFMATHGRGIICLTLTSGRCRRLGLAPQAKSGRGRFGTNFTVSVDAAEGISTGTSAEDRAATVCAIVKEDATPSDLTTPGHMFPLAAADGGVLVRPGHTEAGCDLARMAGLTPAAVICEIMNPDGSMARRDDLRAFADRHNLKIGTIEALIKRRLREEVAVSRESESAAETPHGSFRLAAYRDLAGGAKHLALCHWEFNPESPATVRIVSRPAMLDGILSGNGAGWSVWESLRQIAEDGTGALLALFADSPDASGNNADEGNFRALRARGTAAQILRDLGLKKIRLLSDGGDGVNGGVNGGVNAAEDWKEFSLDITETLERPEQ